MGEVGQGELFWVQFESTSGRRGVAHRLWSGRGGVLCGTLHNGYGPTLTANVGAKKCKRCEELLAAHDKEKKTKKGRRRGGKKTVR